MRLIHWSSSSSCLVLGLWLMAPGVMAQATQIWRCGTEYTNTRPAEGRGCVPITQAAVTVIEGTRVQAPARDNVVVGTAPHVRVDRAVQRQRDQDARTLLQSELARARQQQQRLQQEQQALARRSAGADVSERQTQLREALQRTEADIAGLQREIARFEGGQP